MEFRGPRAGQSWGPVVTKIPSLVVTNMKLVVTKVKLVVTKVKLVVTIGKIEVTVDN